MTERTNFYADMGEIKSRLEASHPLYSIYIQSITMKKDGWLVQFECTPKHERLGHYERVAFVKLNGDGRFVVANDIICQ